MSDDKNLEETLEEQKGQTKIPETEEESLVQSADLDDGTPEPGH